MNPKPGLLPGLGPQLLSEQWHQPLPAPRLHCLGTTVNQNHLILFCLVDQIPAAITAATIRAEPAYLYVFDIYLNLLIIFIIYHAIFGSNSSEMPNLPFTFSFILFARLRTSFVVPPLFTIAKQ